MMEIPVEQRNQHERDFFDQLAHNQCEYWGCQTKTGHYRLEIRAHLACQYVHFTKGMNVVDLGCGLGAFTKYLTVYPATFYALDISPTSISFAKKHIIAKNVNFLVQDANHMQFPDNFFDAVIGNATLHHLDLSRALPEIKRALRSRGKLFFTEPNMVNPEIWLERKVQFIRRFVRNSPDETAFYRWQIKERIQEAGFTNVSVVPFDFLYPAIPAFLISPMKVVSDLLEKIPLIKEIAGSLLITAQKP